jgi:hypothetical protein
MDLNRQALLTTAVAVLGPAAVWHAVRPRQLAATIRAHRVLPGTGDPAGANPAARAATAYAAALVVVELAVTALALATLATDSTRAAGVALALTGAGFVAYVALLLRRDVRGDCGCSPVAASVSRLSLVPGVVLVAAGAVLAADRPFDGSAFADTGGGFETTLALAAAALTGALLSLLPGSALVGDPHRLAPAEIPGREA